MKRALVLGGGGITGVAWEWGILAGLAERGVDLGDADLVVGTSAGSIVGAQVAAGLDVEQRFRSQLRPPDGESAASLGPTAMIRLGMALIGPPAPRQVRARIGRLALRMHPEPEDERLAIISDRLPVHEWPERELKITAVDARTGVLRVFDRRSGVPLVRAVAASCAVPGVWPPISAGGRRYVDGGVRSPANADLAAGYDRVVVIAPIARGIGPIPGVDAQVAGLRVHARVASVRPDASALQAIGRNVLDPAQRAGAARAGRAQAVSVAAEVRAVWS